MRRFPVTRATKIFNICTTISFMKRIHHLTPLLILLILLVGCLPIYKLSPETASSTPLISSATVLPKKQPATATSQPLTESTITPTPHPATQTPNATNTPTKSSPLVFAVIGDFGTDGEPEADVAELVKSWKPAFIITTGDNNNPKGAANTIDENIGKYYHEFIYNYGGKYGKGADQLRFFPVLGNHDWNSNHAQPYLDYFTLPGNERYYDFAWGPVHFFALDSDSREPDGVGLSSVQAQWLKENLSNATEPWKIVFMHHPPYSSATHGPTDWMQWKFKEWGATLAFSGHDHVYERIIRDGFPYITIGTSGNPDLYEFHTPCEGSAVRYRDDYGAIRVEVTTDTLILEYITRKNIIIDHFILNQPLSP